MTLQIERDAHAARKTADEAHKAVVDAKLDAREAAKAAVELERAADFARWTKIQEDAGFTVELVVPDAERIAGELGVDVEKYVEAATRANPFAYARIVELPDGPTHNLTPGA